jgi:threonine aldolase
MKTIDLRSDTITQPTDEMIEAIVQAHKAGRFGDDVVGEDDVINELQEKAARILGKEAALLVTSGTQGNVISLLSQTSRGDEIVIEERSHTNLYEAGAMSSLGGLFPKPVKGVRGYILPETLEDHIRSCRILLHHTIDFGIELKTLSVSKLIFCDNARPHRTEAIKRFSTNPLSIPTL